MLTVLIVLGSIFLFTQIANTFAFWALTGTIILAISMSVKFIIAFAIIYSIYAIFFKKSVV